MPAPSILYRNKEVPVQPTYVRGLSSPAGNSAFPGLAQAAYFDVSTGTSTTSISTPDVTPAQASNVTLISDTDVPLNTRCYITSVSLAVIGAVNWGVTSPTAGAVPYVSLQDTLGTPAVHIPFTALRGMAKYGLPENNVMSPFLLGPNTVNGPSGTPPVTFTSTSTSTATTITASATSWIANIGVGTPVRVVDGGGNGQSGIITAVTATTIAVSPPFVGLTSTSVIGVDYQSLSAYTDTTHVTLFNGGGTPYTANVFDNNYGIVGINGAGVGQVRPIAANTTAGALTLGAALDTAMNATTTLIQVTLEPNLFGIVDCCVGQELPCMNLNRGLQLAVNLQAGTTPVGSAVRFNVQGFFAS